MLYAGGGWEHPHIPYSKPNKGEANSIKAKSHLAAYAHMIPFLVGRGGKKALQPPKVVSRIQASMARNSRCQKFWAFGVEANSASLDWYMSSEIPTVLNVPESYQQTYHRTLLEEIGKAQLVLSATAKEVYKATGRQSRNLLVTEFWPATQDAFWEMARGLLAVTPQEQAPIFEAWHKQLQDWAKNAFRRTVRWEMASRPKKMILAYQNLCQFLARLKDIKTTEDEEGEDNDAN